MTEHTPHYRFRMPDFNTNTWHQEMNDNYAALDALIFEAIAVAGTVGVWGNAEAFNPGDRAVDGESAAVYTCLVSHTSAATGTFAQDRVAHPTYWVVASLVLTPRGAWAQNTFYNVYDIAYQIAEGVSALCIQSHTSTPSGTIRTDASKWAFIIDLAGGTINADDVPYDNGASGLVADNAQDALDEIVASLILKAPKANPTFTGTVTVPTPATSDNSTKAASTAFVVNKLATAGVLTNFSVRVATTGNVNLASELENGDTIDGVVLATNDRVLVKAQSSALANGIYVVPASGAASRATDADTWDEHIGMVVNVAAGTVGAGLSFRSLVNAGGTLGVTAIDFQQFGGSITLPLSIANGGFGGTTAAQARSNIGLVIGTDVQAFHARLADLSGLSYSNGDILYFDTTLKRRAKGTDGQFLSLVSGLPQWVDLAGAAPHIIFEDQQAQNTAGPSYTSGADRTVRLNTEVRDILGIASISSNQFTLSVAGTYAFKWQVPMLTSERTQSILRDMTNAVDLKRGMVTHTNNNSSHTAMSNGYHVATFAGATTLELRIRISNATSQMFAANFGTEVYAEMHIWKLA